MKYSLSVDDRYITLRIDAPGIVLDSDNLSLEMDDDK